LIWPELELRDKTGCAPYGVKTTRARVHVGFTVFSQKREDAA